MRWRKMTRLPQATRTKTAGEHEDKTAAGHEDTSSIGQVKVIFPQSLGRGVSPGASKKANTQARVVATSSSPSRRGIESSKGNSNDDISSKAASHDHNDYDGKKSTTGRSRNRKKKKQQQQQETPEQRIATLHLKAGAFEELYEKEKANAQKLSTTNRDLGAVNTTRRKRQAELSKQVRTLESELNNVRKSSADSQRAHVETKRLIEETHRIGSGATDSLDDDHLRDRLKEVRMLWQGLVSESAISSIEGILRLYIERLLAQAMPKPLPLLETRQLYQLFIKEPGAPRMLLGIFVSNLLCETLFQDPFAFLAGASEGKKVGLQMILTRGMLSE
jgi:hypothetical protein